MRATYATTQGACIHCDACGDNRSSTSRIVAWGIAGADGKVHNLLWRAASYGHRDYGANTLTFEACPACLTKIARRCDVCGNDKAIDRDHCPVCARAFAVADRQETMMAKTLEEIRAVLAERDKKHAETLRQIGEMLDTLGASDSARGMWLTLPVEVRQRYAFHDGQGIRRANEDSPVWVEIRQQEAQQRTAQGSLAGNPADQLAAAKRMMESLGISTTTATTDDPRMTAAELRAMQERKRADQQKETQTMTTPKTDAPNLRSELDAAAWRAGIEIATEEGRDLLVSLLTDGMSDDEAAAARPLFAKAFAGRFGVPIVAGAIGGVLHAVQSAGVEIPLVTPATAARIGEEMRVLSASGMMKVVYRSGRDLIAKHGGKMLEAIANLGKIAERTGVRVDPAPAEVEAPAESQATRSAPLAGARA